MKSTRKLSLSLSTWFCVPEFGMKDMEILTRASAAVVANTLTVNNKYKYHVVTSSHSVAPWLWPKYYGNDWLRAVNETHTHYTVEVRNEDGTFITSLDLLPKSFHHSRRDVAAMHFEEGDKAIEMLSELGLLTFQLPKQPVDELLPQTEPIPLIAFEGHDIRGPVLEDGSDMRKPYPFSTQGVFYGRTKTQCLIKTNTVLPLGMCGGPMFSPLDLSSVGVSAYNATMANGTAAVSRRNKDQPGPALSPTTSVRLLGIVEGIVPTDYPIEALRGMAVVVEPPELHEFLQEVDNDEASRVLVGGQAAAFVGADHEDESKLDLISILKKTEASTTEDHKDRSNFS